MKCLMEQIQDTLSLATETSNVVQELTEENERLKTQLETSQLEQLETNADLLEQICDLQIMNGDE